MKKIIGPFYNYLPGNSKRVPLRIAVIDELLLPDVHVDYGNAPVVGRSTPVQQNCSYYMLSLLRCHLSTPSSSLRRITMTVLRNLLEVLHLRDLECIHRRARIIIVGT